MYARALSTPVALIAAGVMMLGFAASTDAGQFKTLNTQDLVVGDAVQATSSAKNTGDAMEMEVFEFTTAPEGGTYSCNILANFTGRTLNIALVGVAAAIITSCSAEPGGTCSTSPTGLAGNVKFQCLVATQFGAPVVGGDPVYRMSVNRS